MRHSEIARTAREIFGWEALREGQSEAIAALAAGRDAIVILPTGAGKSAVYQLAGHLREGLTLVVSPLIALQDDQVAQLASAPHAPRGAVLNSTLTERAADDLWGEVTEGRIGCLFLTPEQLSKDDVIDRLRAVGVGLFAVDEAHCVASWGHDFRPDYLRLGAVRERLGAPPIVALTATGAEPVRAEIAERLGLHDPEVIVRGVDRPNLELTVRRIVTADDKRDAVIESVASTGGSGLLYTATRREAEQYAAALAERGKRVGVYHAGLSRVEREAAHRAFLDDGVDVVVATNAFGMGIDKPDVRFVTHASVPESLDSYYQEIGRAGRDGAPAEATLFYRPEDLGIRKYFVSRTVDRDELAAAFRAVARAEGPVPAKALAAALGVAPRRALHLLNLLAEGGAVRVGRRGAVVEASVSASAAAAAAEEASERRGRIERSRLDVMRRYAETRDCRRRVLLRYFGEDLAGPCGHCDTCQAGVVDDTAVDESGVPFPAGSAVEHAEWGRGSVSAVEGDRLTVFFEEQGYKTLALDTVIENGLLSRAG
ncbi:MULTISPECIES: RecQ family ATP-dependent DNA helicase [Microbacterium]|uniref:RecQ family ATP-dependent DNA helicase n=1 Tax=Microbacterium TaxID=33882 RepID=UPI000D64714E|nr:MULTISPECIES: RecQ family ATP-dependent DNA helicase [Microbacterium]